MIIDDEIGEAELDLVRRRKEEVVRLRNQRRFETRMERRRERACFWWWPFGHVWVTDSTSLDKRCAACAKIRFHVSSSPYGP